MDEENSIKDNFEVSFTIVKSYLSNNYVCSLFEDENLSTQKFQQAIYDVLDSFEKSMEKKQIDFVVHLFKILSQSFINQSNFNDSQKSFIGLNKSICEIDLPCNTLGVVLKLRDIIIDLILKMENKTALFVDMFEYVEDIIMSSNKESDYNNGSDYNNDQINANRVE